MDDKDVLFQKVGHVWYVFCEVGDGMVYTPLPSGVDPRLTKLELFEVIEEHLEQIGSKRRLRPPPQSVA